jgi:hypothetical protein
VTPFGFETRIFCAASSALLDAPVDRARADFFLRDFGERAPWYVGWGLRAMILGCLLAPLLFARRLFAASREDRARVWEKALAHRSYSLRQLALLFKALVCLCWFDEDAPGKSRALPLAEAS